jgi:hypothetical protein
MSDSNAIEAVTTGLRDLLQNRCVKLDDGATDDPKLAGLQVTVQPLHKARSGTEKPNQLNLFLYETTPDAAWRNQPVPGAVKPGEAGLPPLALTLHYLITAFGADDDETLSHRILGRAMRVLYDFPLLPPDEIAQAERVRITPAALTTDDISKLWMVFQTEYRVSAAYQVSVVLIESSRGLPPAPPVLRRGPADAGADATAAGLPPVLTDVALASKLPVARRGDVATVRGQNLDALTALLVQSPYLLDPVRLTQFSARTPASVTVPVDGGTAAAWAAGLLSLAGEYSPDGRHALRTNGVPFALAPTFDLPLVPPGPAAGGQRLLKITGISPPVLPPQRVLLALNSDGSVIGPDGKPVAAAAQVPPQPRSATDPAVTLSFNVAGLPPARYLVRLRIDGVDSVAVVRDAQTGLLSFDPQQKVTL